jgi:hypothetical protein
MNEGERRVFKALQTYAGSGENGGSGYWEGLAKIAYAAAHDGASDDATTKNPEGKRRFLRELVAGGLDALLLKVEKLPQDWDGHELRQLCADYFAAQTFGRVMGKHTQRRAEYENAVWTMGLL